MRLSERKLKKLLSIKGLCLKELLAEAHVSKTAYYAQLGRESVLPRSIRTLARVLNVKPLALLEEESAEEVLIRRLQKKLENILAENPQANRENVWHTLLLLHEKPIERLRRGLARAQKFDFHG